MKNVLFELWKAKEIELNTTIRPYDIARKTGLHPQTVERILNGTTTRVDLPKVDLVCKALDIESNPIFVYEADNESRN